MTYHAMPSFRICIFTALAMTMTLVFFILFLFSAGLIFYSYVIYPIILNLISRPKKNNEICWTSTDELPPVSIILSVFNEKIVILDKLKSISNLNYPAGKLEILIGSDCSDDGTDEILMQQSSLDSRIRFIRFEKRRGKPSVINDLLLMTKNPVLIMTDANVMFDPEVINKLVRHFRNPKIGLVGANIVNIGMKRDGISEQEKSYIERENLIKYREGVCWGTMMGPFGGCYAMRKELYEAVPPNFLVDDFYICMQVLIKKYSCISEPAAVCYEDVSNDLRQEYKRKSRISAGNFQNLTALGKHLCNPFSALGFCFLSHKLIRWFTPFLILISICSLAYLSLENSLCFILLIGELLLISSPLFDLVIRKMGFHPRLLRYVAYFSYMNLALLRGFFNYSSGVKGSTWTPTKRNPV